MTVPGKNKDSPASNFAALSSTYDSLHFLRIAARQLVKIVPLQKGRRVLDVATGTGEAAITASVLVGTTGSVTGIDRSSDMIDIARRKFTELTNISFQVGDAEHLEFPDRSFDAVLCGAALFIMPDMPGVLEEFRRVLVPGGVVIYSSFGQKFLEPLRSLWEDRIRSYDLIPAFLPTYRLADPDVCRDLLAKAGFRRIEIRTEQLGYHLATAAERWADIIAGLEGNPLMQIEESLRSKIMHEHFKELAGFLSPQGLWIDVPVIYSIGWKES